MYKIKKNLMIVCLIVGILLCSTVFALSSYYYYGDGIQRPLLLSGEKVTAKFVPMLEPDDITNFILSDSAFDPNREPEPTMDEFWVLYVLPGNDIKALIQRMRAREEIEMANPVYLTTDSMELIVSSHFIAEFYSSVSRSYIDSLNALHGVIIVDSLTPRIPNLFVLQLTGEIDQDVLVTANQYYEDPSTDYSHPDFLAEIVLDSSIPNDSFFQYQWNYENTGQIEGYIDADIDASLAWEICKGDTSVYVAVIDQGVTTHEDITFLAPGYDVVGADRDSAKEDNDPTPHDSCAHGEACAGLIAGTQNNILGIAGLAPYCKIVPIKIFDEKKHGLTWCGGASEMYVALAFFKAIELGVSVASNSWSYNTINCDYYVDVIARAIKEFVSPNKLRGYEGGVAVFSSGNSYRSCVNFPASLYYVIAVGASNSFDEVWDYSNGGTALDLVAPSGKTGLTGDIWTMDLMGAKGYNPTYTGTSDANGNQNYTAKFGGTSAACPQVAAAAALVKVQWKKLYPSDTLDSYEVMMILENSAQYPPSEVGDTSWKDSRYGYGRLNAFRALLAISRGDVNNDKSITVTDITYLIAYLMQGGPAPVPVMEMADANCDGKPSIGDVVWLINYLFKGGPKPLICYKYPHNY